MAFLTQGKTNFKYIFVILILALLVSGGILWRAKTQEKPSQGETVDWKTYKNEEYGFEIKYPKDWTTKEEVKRSIGSIKEQYILDIFHPENIKNKTEPDIFGNVLLRYVVHEDNKKFFGQQLDLMKRQNDLTIEEIAINGVKGFRGIAYQESGKGASMYISQLVPDKYDRGVFLIFVDGFGQKNLSRTNKPNPFHF